MSQVNTNSKRKINENVMENIEILAKLSIHGNEREKIMSEMEKILSYVHKLNEIDTNNVEPLINVIPFTNVFREDDVKSSLDVEDVLENAPHKKDNQFVVPKTI